MRQISSPHCYCTSTSSKDRDIETALMVRYHFLDPPRQLGVSMNAGSALHCVHVFACAIRYDMTLHDIREVRNDTRDGEVRQVK